MKHNVQKPVWIPYPLVPFFSVWEEASEDVYIHRHISNSDAIVPYDEHFHGRDGMACVTCHTAAQLAHIGFSYM